MIDIINLKLFPRDKSIAHNSSNFFTFYVSLSLVVSLTLLTQFSNFSFFLSLLLCLITAGRAKDNHTFENKPLVIAKPIVLNDNKIQTVTESDALESKIEKIALNETPASG